MKKENLEIRKKFYIIFSIGLLSISVGLQTVKAFSTNDNYQLEYEYINIKDMAESPVAMKIDHSNIIDSIINGLASNGAITEIGLPSRGDIKEEEMPVTEQNPVPRQVWRLPTEIGRVTQNPHYGHAALDITSPRGSNENIFPVANGVITGIYTDPAGALVITILHDIDGRKYTSQYAHLSSYANGLYLGKPVTVNDVLGKMGTTGYSTGIHLHLAVVECALFDPNDVNCSDLNSFFNFANQRAAQGYLGLGSHIIVPGQWNSR